MKFISVAHATSYNPTIMGYPNYSIRRNPCGKKSKLTQTG